MNFSDLVQKLRPVLFSNQSEEKSLNELFKLIVHDDVLNDDDQATLTKYSSNMLNLIFSGKKDLPKKDLSSALYRNYIGDDLKEKLTEIVNDSWVNDFNSFFESCNAYEEFEIEYLDINDRKRHMPEICEKMMKDIIADCANNSPQNRKHKKIDKNLLINKDTTPLTQSATDTNRDEEHNYYSGINSDSAPDNSITTHNSQGGGASISFPEEWKKCGTCKNWKRNTNVDVDIDVNAVICQRNSDRFYGKCHVDNQYKSSESQICAEYVKNYFALTRLSLARSKNNGRFS